MRRTFFIIPGFGQKTNSPALSWLKKLSAQKGFDAVVVPINWPYRVMFDYCQDFEKLFRARKTQDNYVLGFSYGAVIALCTANTLRPKKIFLCSLSPDFAEDISAMKPWIQRLVGKKRIADIRTRQGRSIAKKLQVPSIVFYGTREGKIYPQLKRRCEETSRLARHSRLVIIPDAPHKLDHSTYIASITKEISRILSSR